MRVQLANRARSIDENNFAKSSAMSEHKELCNHSFSLKFSK